MLGVSERTFRRWRDRLGILNLADRGRFFRSARPERGST